MSVNDIMREKDIIENIGNEAGGSMNIAVAAKLNQGIDKFLAKATPIGGSAGDGADVQQAFNTAWGSLQDTERMVGFQRKAALPGGPSVMDQTQSWLQGAKAQGLAKTGAIGTAADTPYGALARMGKPSTLADLAPGLYDLRHITYPALFSLAGAATGKDPTDMLERAAEGMAVGLGAGYALHRIPVAKNLLYGNRQIANTIAEAQRAASTGSRFAYKGPIGQMGMSVADALRTLLASGRLQATQRP
jgi:hypothetical protein